MWTMVSGQPHTPDATPLSRIAAYLAEHTTATLAYADADGPQACAVFYALTEDGAGVPVLRFVSSTSTRHGAALAAGPADGVPAAFTVHRDEQVWTSLTGIQGNGLVHRLAGEERRRGFDRYLAAFPFIAASETLRDALARTDLWELVPDRLRMVDNGRGFGHKDEWTREEWVRGE